MWDHERIQLEFRGKESSLARKDAPSSVSSVEISDPQRSVLGPLMPSECTDKVVVENLGYGILC